MASTTTFQRVERQKVKTDPENLFISRDDFIKKRQKNRELEARVKAFTDKTRAEIESELSDNAPTDVVVEKKAKKSAKVAD